MEQITSRDNRRIKEAAKLLRDRSFREETGLFLLEGLRICLDVARTTGLGETLFFTQKAADRFPREVALLSSLCREQFLITQEVAGKLSDTKAPQGVFCLCRRREEPLPQPGKGEQILVLEQVSDPGNMGTILRTAEAFGVSRLVLTRDCVDLYSPKVLRASMGSAFRLKLQWCDSGPEAVDWLVGLGFPVYAAALAADSVPLGAVSLGAPVACVVGNEGNGVTQQAICRCTGKIIIPMEGQIESLNVAVASSVLLWEMKRARG